MRQVQIDDALYEKTMDRAREAGFSSVDEFVADIVSQEVEAEPENLDHLFTPERLAELDKICAEIDAGAKTFTSEEVREYFEEKRRRWLKDHGS